MPIIWEKPEEKCERSKDGKHFVTTHEDEETLFCVNCKKTLGRVI